MTSTLGSQYLDSRNALNWQSQYRTPSTKANGSKDHVQDQTLSKKSNGSNVMSLLGSITNKLIKNPLIYLLLGTNLGQVSAQESPPLDYKSPPLDYMGKCGSRYPNLSEQDTTRLKNLETAFNNDEDHWQFYKIYNEARKTRHSDEMLPEFQRILDAGKSYEGLLTNQDKDVLSETTKRKIKKLWENNDALKIIFPTIKHAIEGMVERIEMNKQQRLRFYYCHEL